MVLYELNISKFKSEIVQYNRRFRATRFAYLWRIISLIETMTCKITLPLCAYKVTFAVWNQIRYITYRKIYSYFLYNDKLLISTLPEFVFIALIIFHKCAAEYNVLISYATSFYIVIDFACLNFCHLCFCIRLHQT